MMRTFCPYANDAGGRVFAEQSALRPAQHFDRFDVVGLQQLRLHMRHNEIVNEHSYRRFPIDEDVRLPGTADSESSRVKAGDLGRRKIWHQRGDATDVVRKQFREVLRSDCGDCDRRRLDIGASGTSCRSYENFLEYGTRFLRG